MRINTAFTGLLAAGVIALAGCNPTNTATNPPADNTTAPHTTMRPTTPDSNPGLAPSNQTVPNAATNNASPTAPNKLSSDETNTKINERDRSPNAITPIDQDETQADINVTAEIRQRIVGTDDLSINARNVKIITSQGKTVLRGPVNTLAEKELIEKIAHDVAGEGNVTSEIEVAK